MVGNSYRQGGLRWHFCDPVLGGLVTKFLCCVALRHQALVYISMGTLHSRAVLLSIYHINININMIYLILKGSMKSASAPPRGGAREPSSTISVPLGSC